MRTATCRSSSILHPLSSILLFLCLLAPSARAQFTGPTPPEKVLERIGIDQKLNAQIPLDLTFRDELGRDVKIGDYFGEKPVLLALVYYRCPMLCTMTLNGMVSAFRPLKYTAGQDFEVVTVSFDPRETADMALAKKNAYVKDYNRDGAAAGWHFLTGSEESVKKLAETVGFRYFYDFKTDQYAHASGVMLATPDGRLSRYFYGLEYSARDLQLGVVEASQGKIGTLAEKLMLLCYQYDPAAGKYGVAIMRSVRTGGVLMILAMVGLWFVTLRRPQKANAEVNDGRKP